jgi:DNA-directed RNA polymerase subunit L
MKGFDFLIQGEDHTLGNLFQSWMESNLMDINEITYVGYKIPHPLRDEMVLRIGVEDGQEVTARAALVKAAKGCAEMFHAWREDWTRVTGAGMGTRTRESLRPTVKNATAVVAATSASVAATATPATSAATATATGKRSAFWGKK